MIIIKLTATVSCDKLRFFFFHLQLVRNYGTYFFPDMFMYFGFLLCRKISLHFLAYFCLFICFNDLTDMKPCNVVN